MNYHNVSRITYWGALVFAGILLGGCSTPYRFVGVEDATITGNQMTFLLRAERGVEYGYLHHGNWGKEIARTYGIATCSLGNEAASKLRVLGTKPINEDRFMSGYNYGLCSTQSCLIGVGQGLREEIQIVGQGRERRQNRFIEDSGSILL